MNAESDLMVTDSTQFCFQHRVFSVEGSYFEADEVTETALFHLPMSGPMVAIDLSTLRDEFGIGDDSKDGRLLDVVKNSLRYVKKIRVNDDIPKELLDGSASWSVEDCHRRLAEGHVTLRLVSWSTGREIPIGTMSEMEQTIEDPETKKRLEDALITAAKAMDFPPDDAGKKQVDALVQRLSHELSFIEGLRDFSQRIGKVGRSVSYLQRRFARVATILEDLGRVDVLLKPVIKQLDLKFDKIDAKTCETLSVFKHIDQHVKEIREVRDDMHHEFMRWGEPIDHWSFDLLKTPDETVEKVVRETYRFLARYYPQAVVWER